MTNEKTFKDIAVGNDGSVWAIGKEDGVVYRLYGDAGLLGWSPDQAGKGETISAEDGGSAWLVNKENEIWHLENGENHANGGSWTMVPTHSGKNDAETIAAGSDGSVWYTVKNGTIFRKPQPGDGTNAGAGWVEDKRIGKEKVKAVAIQNQDDVWGISRKDKILHWENGKWTQVLTYNGRVGAKSISVGEDDSVWYISQDDEVYFYMSYGKSWREDNNWDQKRMGVAEVVAVRNQKDVWVLNNRGEVWRSLDRDWQQVVEIGPQ